MIAANRNTFSAVVRASLRVGSVEYNVAQVGNGYLILRDPQAMGPTNAEMLLSIDDVEERQQVYLSDGIDPNITRTAYRRSIDDNASENLPH
jgi:hypothetical protein